MLLPVALQIDGPIALFNIVTYTRLLYNANNFHIQELGFASTPEQVAELRGATVLRVLDLSQEYQASARPSQCNTQGICRVSECCHPELHGDQ
jgi:hypothetical protein